MRAPTALPWRKPRRELLVLALVAVAALAPFYRLNVQDRARLCLSQSLVHGHLDSGGCYVYDRALYKGREYSDKAPGLALLQLPLTEAFRVPPARELTRAPWQLWPVRILSVGVAFLTLAFLVGRIAEGLSPGFGSISLVAFALGTPVAPVAAVSFDQVPAAALGFGAFVLAWSRRPLLAGLAAGVGVLVEYQTALVAVAVALYLALAGRRSARGLAPYVAGAIPGVALLAAYNWLAFGAPWRLSYRYVANALGSEQASGFFGIRLPREFPSYEVFVGPTGLLVSSPVLVASAWGLVLLWRRYPREVVVCAAVGAAFVLLNCGYFLPYGGSPVPRFLVPGLPFLAVGLGPAFAWRPRLAALLALLSVVATTGVRLVFSDIIRLPGGIWGQLVHVPTQLGSSHFVHHLESTVFGALTPGRAWGAAIVALVTLAAFAVAMRTTPRQPALLRPARPLVVVGIALVAAAYASVVFGYPYRHLPSDLVASIEGTPTTAHVTHRIDLVVTARDASAYQGYRNVVLTIRLPPGLRLADRPRYERGAGCTGTTTISCRLSDLSPGMSTPVRIGAIVSGYGPQEVTASLTASGVPPQPSASFTAVGV